MENVHQDPELQPHSSFVRYFFLIIVAIVIIGLTYAYNSHDSEKKVTIDDKLATLKTLREEKKSHEQAIYTINQKIVPLKCSIYSDVQAKEQWDLECQNFFQEQQSKIREGSVQAIENIQEDLEPVE